MFLKLLLHHFYFCAHALRFFSNGLRLPGPTPEKCFLASMIALLLSTFFTYYPLIYYIIAIPSFGVFITDGVSVLKDVVWLHRLYFCCGEGAGVGI